MKNIIFILLWLGTATAFLANGQVLIGRDTVLSRERTLDRPLNLHSGQIRITAGYGINLNNDAFDDQGSKYSLREDGLASLRHQGQLDIRYGLSEYLQIGLQYGYSNETITKETILLYGYPAGLTGTIITESATFKGSDDIIAQVDFRFPFRTRMFDLLLQAGSELPTGPTLAYMPDHSIGLDESGRVQQLDYRYRYATGRGVVTPFIGGAWKHRLGSVAYTFYGSYRHSLQPATVYTWESYMLNGKFVNTATAVQRTLPDEIRLGGEFEIQASPIFNLSLQAQYRSQSRSWQTSANGDFALIDSYLLQAGLGYELIITPRLWLRQRLLLPLSGSSARAGTILQSSLSYNLFAVK